MVCRPDWRAVVMVLFSRLIDFEPGYLYGFVCGVLFTRELPTNEKGHLAALSVCTTLVVSALAWMAWIPVNAAALRPGAFVGVVLADDLLGALFVSGLVGSFFGMMPIQDYRDGPSSVGTPGRGSSPSVSQCSDCSRSCFARESLATATVP